MQEGMCGECHDAPSHHDLPNQFLTTPHADLEQAREEGASTGSCVRCHGAQGYLAHSGRLAAGNAAPFTSTEVAALGITDANVEPITCPACHDPHDATNPNQLRAYDVATDCYSSTSGSSSNVVLDQIPASATFDAIHGQIGFCFVLPTPATWTRAGTGCSGSVTDTNVCFQVGTLVTGAPPAVVLPTTDTLIKAGGTTP